jgi:hypothetical protein
MQSISQSTQYWRIKSRKKKQLKDQTKKNMFYYWANLSNMWIG